jgi:hypothetical protein
MGLFDRLRSQPEWMHADPKVRRTAVAQLEDPEILAELARSDPDDRVREEAADSLLDVALAAEDESTGLSALAGLSEPRHLVSVARSAPLEPVGRAALERLTDVRAIGSVARNGAHAVIRLEALSRLQDSGEISAVALKSEHREVALAALERIESLKDGRTPESMEEILAKIAHRARNRAVVHRARAMLHERDPESGETSPEQTTTDRQGQIDICEALEAMARAEGTKRLAPQISSMHDAWTDLLPNVDDDLEQRFQDAYEAARRHLAQNQAALAEHRRQNRQREEFQERYIAPRIELCEKVERAEGEQAKVLLDDARWEWERLEPLESEEAADLLRHFESACEECERRHRAWEEEQAASRAEAERLRAREERTKLERDNAARLRQLCDNLERMLQSKRLTLRPADRSLRQVRKALEEIGPLPSRRDQRELTTRLKAIQAGLSPRVREMRSSESWERWANTNIQEKLCTAAENLREVADAEAASRRLGDLQARWRTASTAMSDRAQELWQRFKAAHDEVHSRVEAHRAELAAKKESLCEQAESLADSTDWIKTAETLKRLQLEWKTIGSAGRGRDKTLWERFRAGCDRFFSRRKADLAKRKEEWQRNLKAKQGLCEQVEALIDSHDWQKTATAIQKLQAEWKATGPVGKSKSEAIWKRFRTACDRFFDRFKRRDEIDMERHLEERAALCAEVEALQPSGDSEQILAALRDVRERWQRSPVLPRAKIAAVEVRFNTALGRLIEANSERVQGTDLDADANRHTMEEICSRVERLLPSERQGVDAAASPATRLATLWVEAMASNTIGGKVAQEARWRTAEEELKKAQIAWRKIGYVPDEVRRPLAERFDAACRKFHESRPRPRQESHARSRPERKPSGRRRERRR